MKSQIGRESGRFSRLAGLACLAGLCLAAGCTETETGQSYGKIGDTAVSISKVDDGFGNPDKYRIRVFDKNNIERAEIEISSAKSIKLDGYVHYDDGKVVLSHSKFLGIEKIKNQPDSKFEPEKSP